MLFQFKRVSKSFGVHQIFQNLDFLLDRGTFSILTGRSGSGKTTLFKMLCGVERPTDGEIIFLGRKLSEHSPLHLKQIGFVFQHPRGLPDQTVFDNVALPLVIDRVTAAQREKRVMHWLEQLGLRSRTKSLYRELSGGERQKAEIARALIRKPRMILADEPTAHLDSVQADHILDLLWGQYQDGATVFISTHNPPKFSHPKILRFHLANHSIRLLEPDEVAPPKVPEVEPQKVPEISARVVEPLSPFFEGGV